MPKGPRPRAPEERFWQYVAHEPNTGCWLWFGAATTLGYGMIRVGSTLDGTRRFEMAHRFSYELHERALKKEEVIDHLCRVPSCVNPHHMEPVSRGENVKRGLVGNYETNPGVLHGRSITHCLNGHPLFGDNVHFAPSGRRVCKTCRRKRNYQQYLKRVGKA